MSIACLLQQWRRLPAWSGMQPSFEQDILLGLSLLSLPVHWPPTLKHLQPQPALYLPTPRQSHLQALSVGRLHRAAQLAFASYFPSREFEQLGGLEGAPVAMVEDTVTDAQVGRGDLEGAYVCW